MGCTLANDAQLSACNLGGSTYLPSGWQSLVSHFPAEPSRQLLVPASTLTVAAVVHVSMKMLRKYWLKGPSNHST